MLGVLPRGHSLSAFGVDGGPGRGAPGGAHERPSRRRYAGKPSLRIRAAVPITVIPLTLKQSECSHDNDENQECPHGDFATGNPKANDCSSAWGARARKKGAGRSRRPLKQKPRQLLRRCRGRLRGSFRGGLCGKFRGRLCGGFGGRLRRGRSALSGWRALLRLHFI